MKTLRKAIPADPKLLVRHSFGRNARSGAFRRSLDLRLVSSSAPSFIARGVHDSRPSGTERSPRPVSSSPPHASAQQPVPPAFANEPAASHSTQSTLHQPPKNLDASSRPSGGSRMGQSSKRVADARSPSVSDRDDSARRRRLIQEASPQTRYPTKERVDKASCFYSSSWTLRRASTSSGRVSIFRPSL